MYNHGPTKGGGGERERPLWGHLVQNQPQAGTGHSTPVTRAYKGSLTLDILLTSKYGLTTQPCKALHKGCSIAFRIWNVFGTKYQFGMQYCFRVRVDLHRN